MKKCFSFYVFVFGLLIPCHFFAQHISMMKSYESRMVEAMQQMYFAPTDNERLHANEQFLTLLDEILHQPESFHYPFDSLSYISRITASDKKFRIFSWSVVRQDGVHEVFGYLQSRNDNAETYDVYPLTNKSDEIFRPEEERLPHTRWYGCVYYDLIEVKANKHKYYTLLGFDGHNIYTQRKVIEILDFRGESSVPSFGYPLFAKEKGIRRKVFEYTKDAPMVLRFEKQPYEKKEKKRMRWSLKPKYQLVTQMVFVPMLIFEELEPVFDRMEGLRQYYAPSGIIHALQFEDGKWKQVEKPMPRNPKTKYDHYDDQSIDNQHPFYDKKRDKLFPETP